MTEEDYLAVVDHWLAIDEFKTAEQYYEKEVLPRSVYQMRQQAPEEQADLLLVPVGTQPYAPLLCCLGNPAKKTVLFMTEDSRPCARQVENLLSAERAFQSILVSEVDSGDIVRKVMAAFDALGQPSDVICDITGGTKIMTASLAGIAAVNGWRQVYVGSTFIRSKGSHSERIIPVASVFDHLGGWHTVQAWKLASVGVFGEAARCLKAAAEKSLASRLLRQDIRRFLLAEAYRQAELPRVLNGLRAVTKAHGVSLPAKTWEVIKEGDPRGLHFWIASTLSSEGNRLAACSVLSQLGLSLSPSELKAGLQNLKRENRQQWSLDAWKPVDAFLGAPYSREIARRV